MHDAFPYYARAYGLDVVGVAVGAPGQDPSAAEITALVDTIRQTGVKAVFAEDQFSPKLVEALASETGTTVVVGPVRRLAGQAAGHLLRAADPLGHRADRRRAALVVAVPGRPGPAPGRSSRRRSR